MPQTVAGIAGVRVAGVFPPDDAAVVQQIFQGTVVRAEQGAQQMPFRVFGPHASQCRPAGTAQKTEHLVFGHIAPVMPQQDGCSTACQPGLLQQRVARQPGCFFRSQAVLLRQSGHICCQDAAGNVPALTEPGHEGGIPGGFRPQLMVHRRHMQLPAMPGGQQGHDAQKSCRIRTAGNSQQPAFTVSHVQAVTTKTLHIQAQAGQPGGKRLQFGDRDHAAGHPV